MASAFRMAILMIVVMTILTGLAYPLAITGLAQLIFPDQAKGSLIVKGDKVVGSALIGQYFSKPEYFHPRPSAANASAPAAPDAAAPAPDASAPAATPAPSPAPYATPAPAAPASAAPQNGYDPTNSAATNLAPSSKKLVDSVTAAVAANQPDNPGRPVPGDLVTSSASGLDPDITPAAADFQVPRVAKARGMTEDALRAIVAQHTKGRTLGFLGEPRVNVLELNLALDQTAAK
jgi:K+-transporting ATPase ATPase C chain